MEKGIYEAPSVEVVLFDSLDIICLSKPGVIETPEDEFF